MTAQKITILTVATLILSVAGAAASEQAEISETPVAQALDAVLDIEIEQPSKLESQEQEQEQELDLQLDLQLAWFPWDPSRRGCRKGHGKCKGGSQQFTA